jgi:hypothetical protein
MSDAIDTIAGAELARQPLQAPFPWFGGKSRAAPLIWERFGRVANYVEPFAGSLAVLLGAPRIASAETVNDLDGFIANFWRAVAYAPEETAKHCDWPVNEADLHARHVWLLEQRQDLTDRLMGDPEFFDAKIAGWWCWGICCWIGSGWCNGDGSWVSQGGKLVKSDQAGIKRQRVHLDNSGRGVHRQRVHLGDLGQGVHRKRGVYDWFAALGERLRRVRVCCGDWQRLCGPTPTFKLGLTGIVLDPPYSTDERDARCYGPSDSGTVAADCREWALANGDNPLLRIALCGYDTEHDMPGWSVAHWKAKGGYGSGRANRADANATRETIWFSPHCLNAKQGSLF